MTTTSMSTFFSIIAEKLGGTLVRHLPLSGGDISSVHLLETGGHRFVVKSNSVGHAYDMFEQEVAALRAIAETHTIATPKVHLQGREGNVVFLVMDYLESKQPARKDFKRFGSELAQLHSVSNLEFGWSSDNYIGSLLQSNNAHADWPSFYVQERLLPQLELAVKAGLLNRQESPSYEKLLMRASDMLPSSSPALVHGDLWNGNFLIAVDGTPYLIDPAIYFGHGEVDLAMSRLFGGFDEGFYAAYHSVHVAEEGLESRQDCYQLYYLLVHLNIFGSAYSESVKKILTRYFR